LQLGKTKIPEKAGGIGARITKYYHQRIACANKLLISKIDNNAIIYYRYRGGGSIGAVATARVGYNQVYIVTTCITVNIGGASLCGCGSVAKAHGKSCKGAAIALVYEHGIKRQATGIGCGKCSYQTRQKVYGNSCRIAIAAIAIVYNLSNGVIAWARENVVWVG
jgi:hypothetical protein